MYNIIVPNSIFVPISVLKIHKCYRSSKSNTLISYIIVNGFSQNAIGTEREIINLF